MNKQETDTNPNDVVAEKLRDKAREQAQEIREQMADAHGIDVTELDY